MSLLLGIDLGTSTAKALLVSLGGEVVGQGSAGYAIHRPHPGWAEQSPEAWWDAVVTAVRGALAGCERQCPEIASIGVSGQMHGTVLVNDSGLPLAPAVIWPDSRSEAQVHEITELIGGRRLIAMVGSPAYTGFQAATVRWLQLRQTDLWAETCRVLCPKDYVRFRMVTEFHSDPSDGSGTLFLDVRRRTWCDDVLEALDVDPSRLPPLKASTAIAGSLRPDAAEAFGLPSGIPVVTGAADTAASALGAGVAPSDELLITLGTGGQIVLPVPDAVVDYLGRIHTFCGALDQVPYAASWYQMAAILSGGMALAWLRDRVLGLSGGGAYEQMTSWAESAPPGANGLLFLPYLAGERTPHMNPRASGLLMGLTLDHGREDLVRAVLEGVALACYDAYQVLAELGARPRTVTVAGGGGQSRLWRQIFADVFDLPVRQLLGADQSAVGAALLAGGGVGILDPATSAREWAQRGAPVMPDGSRHETYLVLHDLFRNAYTKHERDFATLRAIGKHRDGSAVPVTNLAAV